MIQIELPAELEQRLEDIGRAKGAHAADVARRVVLDYLEDVEDVEAAEEALRNPGERHSWEDVKQRFGLED